MSENYFVPPLAASLTKAASQQTYYTIRFLVDRERVPDAYRAYGYFRWLDNQLDRDGMKRADRLALMERQKDLMERCRRAEPLRQASVEEQMLVELIQNDRERNSGLQAYIRNMLAVMEFDANRRGRSIASTELAAYSQHLSIAVTEAMHYFIGHNFYSPRNAGRYLAVTGAHITHMLRDTHEDLRAGYFNIPRELLESHEITPYDVESDAYRAWVANRVRLARSYFKAGRDYLAQVECLRCRLAGYAYMARFESVLNVIEQEGYRLRQDYVECPGIGAKMIRSVLIPALDYCRGKRTSSRLPAHEIQRGEL